MVIYNMKQLYILVIVCATLIICDISAMDKTVTLSNGQIATLGVTWRDRELVEIGRTECKKKCIAYCASQECYVGNMTRANIVKGQNLAAEALPYKLLEYHRIFQLLQHNEDTAAARMKRTQFEAAEWDASKQRAQARNKLSDDFYHKQL